MISEAKRIEDCKLSCLTESALQQSGTDILEYGHLISAGVFEQITRPVGNLELSTVRLPASTLELLDRHLQVLNLEHRQNGGARWPARRSKGPAQTLTGAHAYEIPDLLGLKYLRVVVEVLANVRASDIQKTQDSKGTVGNVYRGGVLRGQIVQLLRTRSSNLVLITPHVRSSTRAWVGLARVQWLN